MRIACALLVVSIGVGCDSGVSLGARCTYSSECPAPLVCGFGRCRAECEEHRDCPLDALCLYGQDDVGTCSLRDDPTCETGASCPASLACFAGQCVNACTAVAECPPDSVCLPGADGRARCVRADVDAGAIDASGSDAALAADAGSEDVGFEDAGGQLDSGGGDSGGQDGGSDAGAIDAGLDASGDAGSVPGDAGSRCAAGSCAVTIASGDATTCALTGTGTVWCWGAVLGDGTSSPLDGGLDCGSAYLCSPTPVQVQLETPMGRAPLIAASIAVGGSSACALLANQQVACWGAGWAGQLGDGSDFNSVARYVRGVGGVGTLEGALAIHAGNEHWIAERESAPRLVGWGQNTQLELAGAGTTREDVPVAIDVGDFESIVVGGFHACVRDRAGELRCWGGNTQGQSGERPVEMDAMPLPGTPVSARVRIDGIPSASRLVASARGTCSIEDEAVRCWGASFALGGGAPIDPGCSCTTTPVPTMRPAPFRELFVAPASDTTFALDASGDVWCWGRDDSSHICATSDAYEVVAPRRRDLGLRPIAIAPGSRHACALDADGGVWCWGDNTAGQLGRGRTSAREATPQRVSFGP